jgi:hypothetical protein
MKTNRKVLIYVRLALLSLVLGQASVATAAGYFLRMGPASIGAGGSNPLGIPPHLQDLELSMITNRGLEFNLGLPGALVGYRFWSKWGGGIAISINGVGPAGYSAFGYDFGWETVRFNFEYKQALGVAPGAVISPYAVRFGIGLWFK